MCTIPTIFDFSAIIIRVSPPCGLWLRKTIIEYCALLHDTVMLLWYSAYRGLFTVGKSFYACNARG